MKINVKRAYAEASSAEGTRVHLLHTKQSLDFVAEGDKIEGL